MKDKLFLEPSEYLTCTREEYENEVCRMAHKMINKPLCLDSLRETSRERLSFGEAAKLIVDDTILSSAYTIYWDYGIGRL